MAAASLHTWLHPAMTGRAAGVWSDAVPGTVASAWRRDVYRCSLKWYSAAPGPGIPHLWVPETSSTSCDQVIFVDRAADASLSSGAVLLKIDRFG